MTRVLITGARGGFGPAVDEHFSQQPGFVVFQTDIREAGGGDYFRCDLCDPGQISALLTWCCPDLILHLAGTISGDFETSYRINVAATRHLLEEVKQKYPKTRVVLTGSAAEYGIVKEQDNPIQESRTPAPISVYGLTKSWQAMMMNYYAELGLDVLLARPFNLIGRGLSESLFVGRVYAQIDELKDGKIERIKVGSLEAVRDYISFADAARQYEAISKYGIAGHVYHVASGRPVSMRSLLADILSEGGIDFSVVEESPTQSNRKGYDVPVIYACVSKTRELMAKME